MTLSSGERSVLLTSLTDQFTYSHADLFEVYRLRWTALEEGYKQQKISLELENFIGQSKLAVLQEFYATLLAATVLAMHCIDAEGAKSIERPQEYRINRNIVMGSLREDVLKVLVKEYDVESFQEKFERIASRAKIKVIPNRSFSREKVGKPKRYHPFRRVC